MKSCDFFGGSRWSNIGRWAFELAWEKTGREEQVGGRERDKGNVERVEDRER